MLQRHEIDAIFDAHQEAPTMSYRYYVTEAIELALEKKRAIQAWQPIETAPKDGRRILVAEDGEIYMVERGMNDWFWISGGHALYVTPTHWMSLPAAPESK